MKWLFYAPARLFSFILLFTILLTGTAILAAKNHLHWGVVFDENSILKTSNGNFKIEAIDLTPEPGEITSDEDLSLFYSRQNKLSNLMKENSIILESKENSLTLTKQRITFTDLSILFWIQIIVGLGATIISGWVWSLRPKSLSTTLFFISGLSTLFFTYSAAIYTTRELALPIEIFKPLVGLNVFGASLFGISILALFLIYPSRFKFSKHLLILESIVFGAWTLLSIGGVLPAWAGVNLITLFEMIGIVLAIITQFFITHGHPKERASLTWLGLSILVGAGGFISLNAIPLIVEIEIPMAQGYAFLFFLAFYFGLAAGIGKYRLFDVGNWAYKFLFYALGAVFLVLLDISFISIVKIERLPALGLSFFIVGFLYLPFRDLIHNFFKKGLSLRPHELIKEAIFVVLSPNLSEKKIRWEKLIEKILNPIEIAIYDVQKKDIEILDEGTTLLLPSIGEIPSYLVKYRNKGKSLFNKESQMMMGQLIKLIEYADINRSTYERGVKEERQRIAQDLHDDVGARLLTGLHAEDSDLRSTIQGALSDIRTIVKGISGESTNFSHFFAEMRAESLLRAEASNLKLNWPFWENQKDFKIDYHIYKAISSTIREIISNTMKHSKASILNFHFHQSQKEIEFCFEDNGQGFRNNEKQINEGLGLKIMKKRITDVGGEFQIFNQDSGLKIIFKVPL